MYSLRSLRRVHSGHRGRGRRAYDASPHQCIVPPSEVDHAGPRRPAPLRDSYECLAHQSRTACVYSTTLSLNTNVKLSPYTCWNALRQFIAVVHNHHSGIHGKHLSMTWFASLVLIGWSAPSCSLQYGFWSCNVRLAPQGPTYWIDWTLIVDLTLCRSGAAAASAWIPLLYDTIIFALTLFRTVPPIRREEASYIVKRLLEDGLLYYRCVFPAQITSYMLSVILAWSVWYSLSR